MVLDCSLGDAKVSRPEGFLGGVFRGLFPSREAL
jgi:hypothetical protein